MGWICPQGVLQGLVAQRITRLTTDQKIAGSNPAEIGFLSWNRLNVYDWETHDMTLHSQIHGQYVCLAANTLNKKKVSAPPGGLEPPTFRLTAERASRLRHGGKLM